MFHEQIAKLTADHLRTHIKVYLDSISAEYSGTDKVTLTVPKSIDPASVVGGLMTEFDQTLPQYGIDVLNKALGEDIEGLFTYNYFGQINGLVSSTSRDSVDKLCSRHARACETFIREHQLMHEQSNANFSVLAFAFVGIDFSGAENLGSIDDREVWVAGFSINVVWATSEDGAFQHG
jgi:hypothetical protein